MEQFYWYLSAGIQRPRRDLPSTTYRQACSPGTNRRVWQGRRRTSRPSLVAVATTTLLKLTRRHQHCHARRCQKDLSSSPSSSLSWNSPSLPPAAPPLLALRHFPFSLLYLLGVLDYNNQTLDNFQPLSYWIIVPSCICYCFLFTCIIILFIPQLAIFLHHTVTMCNKLSACCNSPARAKLVATFILFYSYVTRVAIK